MPLVTFLIKVVGISLTGVMAPGAITAATIAQGSRNRWAGLLISIGHGIIEIPLIFLLIVGLGTILQSDTARFLIGLIGGAFLIFLGIQMLREISRPEFDMKNARSSGPILTGFILSASNPYFLFWWATVGLNLALKADEFGRQALIVFAIVHWLCDLIWLTILSFGSFHGANIMSPKNQKILLGTCAAALILFGGKFIWDALNLWRI